MPKHPPFHRRQFVINSALSAAGLLAGIGQAYAGRSHADGKLLEVLPFHQEGAAPVDTVIGTELDQRRYTDLSRLSAMRLTTPVNEFFIRSGASDLLPDPAKWTVGIDGLVARPSHLDMRALRAASRPMGLHLMECAGNVRIVHFGLISAAAWTGIPLSTLLDHAAVQPGGTQVHITGFDEYAQASQTSVAGAEWIFSLEALKAAGAFLAVGMNGEPLPRDHGAPVRLVVPGWYGCACIKWVRSIALVDDTVEATSQMREYAARTLQSGIPALARDFEAPTIDHAAIPVRVEKWRVASKLHYRILGILWGGAEPVKTLTIRFSPEEDFVTVQHFHQAAHAPWTVWEHAWSPAEPGMYAIQLAVSAPQVRARKMDAGYYVRFVEIGEV